MTTAKVNVLMWLGFMKGGQAITCTHGPFVSPAITPTPEQGLMVFSFTETQRNLIYMLCVWIDPFGNSPIESA